MLQFPRDFYRVIYAVPRMCLYFTIRVTFVIAGRVRYRTASGSGKHIGFGLKIETGTERTTIIDIFDIIQTVAEEQWRIAQGNKRQASGYGLHVHNLSGLRLPDTPHPCTVKNPTVHAFRPENQKRRRTIW